MIRAPLIRVPVCHVTRLAGVIDRRAGVHQRLCVPGVDGFQRLESCGLKPARELNKCFMGGIDPLLDFRVAQLAGARPGWIIRRVTGDDATRHAQQLGRLDEVARAGTDSLPILGCAWAPILDAGVARDVGNRIPHGIGGRID